MKAPIAYMWAAQHSQIYPELNRLAAAGLIEGTVITGRGPRDTKRYHVTVSGQRALTAWADSPLSPETPRSEMLLRVRSLWLVGPDRAIDFVADQHRQLSERLAVLLGEREQFVLDRPLSADDPQFFAYATLRYGLDRIRAAVAWCEWLLDLLEQQQRGVPVDVLALQLPSRPDLDDPARACV